MNELEASLVIGNTLKIKAHLATIAKLKADRALRVATTIDEEEFLARTALEIEALEDYANELSTAISIYKF